MRRVFYNPVEETVFIVFFYLPVWYHHHMGSTPLPKFIPLSLTHDTSHLFTQQIFLECFLCARHCWISKGMAHIGPTLKEFGIWERCLKPFTVHSVWLLVPKCFQFGMFSKSLGHSNTNITQRECSVICSVIMVCHASRRECVFYSWTMELCFQFKTTDMHAYVFAGKAGTKKKHKSKLCAHYVQNH